MAKSSISLLLVCFIFFILEKSQAELLAPALYVFGDSTVDAGNNNNIQTFAKSNYLPYGIDFPGGITGRTTNGQTMADFIGKLKHFLPRNCAFLNCRSFKKIKRYMKLMKSCIGRIF